MPLRKTIKQPPILIPLNSIYSVCLIQFTPRLMARNVNIVD